MTRRVSALSIMVVMVIFLCPKTADAQTREVAFSADEGTWLSLDVSPDSDRLVTLRAWCTSGSGVLRFC